MTDVMLAVQTLTREGIVPVYTAAGASPLLNVVDNFQFNNTGRELLHFKKSGAGACTVTILTPGTVDGLAVANREVTVPASTGDVMVGPFPTDTYNIPGSALTFAGFGVSDVAGLSVAIVRF